MSGRARLSPFVIGLLCACAESAAPPTADQRSQIADDVIDQRARLYAHFEPDAPTQWLERSELCAPRSVLVRLQMASGLFVWPDQFVPSSEEAARFQVQRKEWVRGVPLAIGVCRAGMFGRAVRTWQRDMAEALTAPSATAALERLLDGPIDERNAALDVLRWVPSLAYRERVARIARGGDHHAVEALIEIEGELRGAQPTAAWSMWLQQQLDADVHGFDALLAVAVGKTPEGTPGELTIDVRREAARLARLWRTTTADGWAVRRPENLELAADPDPQVRAEGVRMLDAQHDRDALALLATHDPNPRVKLIAQSKLPAAP